MAHCAFVKIMVKSASSREGRGRGGKRPSRTTRFISVDCSFV